MLFRSRQEDTDRARYEKLIPLAQRLVKRLTPLAKDQNDPFQHPRWELDHLKKRMQEGFEPRRVHQFESAILEAYWVLKGFPKGSDGWKMLQKKRDKERAEGRTASSARPLSARS